MDPFVLFCLWVAVFLVMAIADTGRQDD